MLLAAVSAVFFAPAARGADTVESLERELKSPSMLERHAAAEKLTRFGGADARRIFERLAKRDAAEWKRIGLTGLARVAPERCAAQFAAALPDPRWEVRWAAVYGLGWTGDPAWIERLNGVAKEDSSEQVRKEAAIAVRRIEESPRWQPSLEAARAQASAQKKDLLVFWYLPGAPWNQKMLDEAFLHPDFRKLKEAYVWGRADVSEEKEEAAKAGVKEVPVWTLISPAGNERDRWTGYYGVAPLVAEWKGILEGKPTADQLAEKVRGNPRDMALMMELARRHARNNRPHLAAPLWEKVAESKKIASDKERGEALFALGHFCGASGDHARAVRHLERYRAEFAGDPQMAKAEYCLALSLLATGKKQKSEKILRELSRQNLDASLASAVRASLAEIESDRGRRKWK